MTLGSCRTDFRNVDMCKNVAFEWVTKMLKMNNQKIMITLTSVVNKPWPLKRHKSDAYK